MLRPASPPVTRESTARLLKQQGIHPTRQRIEIAYTLFSQGTHVSAEQLLEAVNLDGAASSKATIYNTLRTLRDKGLIREVIVDPVRVFYDPNTFPHHHFYNVSTGQLMDIPPCDLPAGEVPPAPAGMVTESVDIVIRVRSL